MVLRAVDLLDHPAKSAPLTGTYDDASPWSGWVEDEARTWIAFVAKDPADLALLWTKREAGGGVIGEPTAIRYCGIPATPFGDGVRAVEPGKVVKTVKRHGATFAIDRPIGSVKKGTGFDGKPFELTYSCDYGYLQKTHEDKRPPVGGDGMMVDAYCCEPTTKDGSDSDGDEEAIHVVNQVRYGTNEHDEQKLILGARDADHASQVYFTHSYAAGVSADTAAATTHGERFTAVVQRGHVAGVQFHPELKSRPFEPHPLFASFIEAAAKQSRLV